LEGVGVTGRPALQRRPRNARGPLPRAGAKHQHAAGLERDEFDQRWGLPDTATYGETITATASDTRLSSFTFYLDGGSTTAAPQFQAFVYQWNAATKEIAGPALYASPVMTAPLGNAFSPVTIPTKGVKLTPGQQYVLFFTTSSVSQPATSSSYRYGALPNTTAYPGGQFVFQNNNTNFAALSASGWSTIAEDLAFAAILGGQLAPSLLVPSLQFGAPVNPTNVAAAIDKFSVGGGQITGGFNNLYLLSGQPLSDALTQLSGEGATGAQQGAFQIMNSFMSTMLDPYVEDRGGFGAAGGSALGYAADDHGLPASMSAYLPTTKGAPAVYEPRWNVWATTFGGVGQFNGDGATGSHDSIARAGGFAAGADYHVEPDTLLGFALAGGGTSWSVSGGLGGGTSDVFQAGAYGARQFGPAYVAGAVAFADSWASTSRTVGVAGLDTLTASFDTQSFGARLEGGYHIASPGQVTLTPYGAVQGQVFRTPAYQEGASSGSAQFALGYAGQTATQTRLELGAWADKTFAFAGGDAINVFGRAAYAHDWQSDPTLTATFLSLANASFVVNGAEESPNLALVTLGAEWRGRNGWSFLAKVDGELGKGTQTIAGTARLRYVW
jgi:uncharacterized protein with beta-barrel porin domain